MHAEKGYIVARLAEGHLTTSLNMAGISLSIMAVDDERLTHLDAPCSAPAWPKLSVMPISGKPFVPLPATPPIEIAPGIREVNADFVKRVVRACAEAAVAAEPTLTEQDLKVCSSRMGWADACLDLRMLFSSFQKTEFHLLHVWACTVTLLHCTSCILGAARGESQASRLPCNMSRGSGCLCAAFGNAFMQAFRSGSDGVAFQVYICCFFETVHAMLTTAQS
jgi:hypothetical protein